MLRIILALSASQARRLAHLHPAAVVIDHARHTLWRGATWVRFEPAKFQIIFFIVRRLGGLISKADLFDELWGDDPDGGPDGQEKVIDVQLCKIRKILPALGIRIETVHGQGYRLVVLGLPELADRRAA